MRLGISNIAWPPHLDAEVSALLRDRGLGSVDLAPSKYFDLSAVPQLAEIKRVRRWWESRGLQIKGMQSLMYGSSLNLFGSDSGREEMLNWLDNVCFIGKNLGAERLVFGSPKNRYRTSPSETESIAVASEFFLRLGDVAERHGVTMCLEPNPPDYGANFLVSSAETAAFVSALGHSAIQMQLDTGAMVLCGEDGLDLFGYGQNLVGHIHLSAPGLVPLNQSNLATFAQLKWALDIPGDYIPTIEMLTSTPEMALREIEQSIDLIVGRRFLGLGGREG